VKKAKYMAKKLEGKYFIFLRRGDPRKSPESIIIYRAKNGELEKVVEERYRHLGSRDEPEAKIVIALRNRKISEVYTPVERGQGLPGEPRPDLEPVYRGTSLYRILVPFIRLKQIDYENEEVFDTVERSAVSIKLKRRLNKKKSSR
jgi:hypothetical protein